MKSRFSAVIFDLDGVICSTDGFHYRAWKTVADRLGVPFDEERNDLLRGVGRMESLEIILQKSPRTFTDEEKTAIAEEKNALYREMLAALSPADLSADVRRTLEVLRQAGLLLAIGSSSRNAPFILGRLGLGGFFDAVADGSQITRPKPDPEVFLLAAALLGVSPAEAVVVEDAHAGVAAAAAGGFSAAAIGDAVDDPRAAWHLKRLSELIGILT